MDDNIEDYAVNLGEDLDIEIDHKSNCKDGLSEAASDTKIMGDNNRLAVETDYRRITELSAEDILGLEFGSEGEACDFYCTYAKCHGFVARRHNIRCDRKGNIVMRQLVCNREGLRDEVHVKRVDRRRDHKPITRTNCSARFRVRLDYKTLKWKVVEFVEGHNHELIPPKFMHLIPAYRGLTSSDKAQVDSLHKFGVRTCHIMGYIVGQKGSYADVGFVKKDLYNHIDQQRRTKIKDGDANAAICYLRGKAGSDPLFFGKYTATDDERLENLFWSDGCSMVDYECFGDVIAFDTTYKKNKYDKPLVIFSGANHHAQTTIFGCALVSDEKTETYKWLLETFLEAMGNKPPKAVVTDGDGAMREAIKQVFPDATHRLCAWHLQKNACENVKNPAFLEDFKDMIYSNYTIDEFEEHWKDIISKNGLTNNKWVSKTYDNRAMWAHAYLRDKFFGHIRTTSQCEGINSLIKAYVRKKNTLIEFIQNLELALREYRNNELIADFRSFHSEPVLTTPLKSIESCAAKTFTRKIFMEVKLEIEEAGALNVCHRSEDGDNVLLKMNKFCNPTKEWEVFFDKSSNKFMCECRLFESRGIPCRHIICAMKHEHMDYVPNTLVCRRWTKAAKSEYICSAPAEEADTDKMARLRFGALAADCNKLCHLASKHVDDFIEIREQIFKLITMLTLRGDKERKQSSFKKVVGDPVLVKSKGAPSKIRRGKKRRHCSNCKKTGHYYRRCPKAANGIGDVLSLEEDASLSEMDGLSCKEVDKSENENVKLVNAPNMLLGRPSQSSNIVEKSDITKKQKVHCHPARLKEGRGKCPNQISSKQNNAKEVKNEVRSQNAAIHETVVDNRVVGSIGPKKDDAMCSQIPRYITPHYAPSTSYLPMAENMHTFPQFSLLPVFPQPSMYPQFPIVSMYSQPHQGWTPHM